MKNVLLYFLFFNALIAFATHNRAGEILYKRIDPQTQVVGGVTVPVYKYLITVIKYTNDGTSASSTNLIVDRCKDTIYFGDGTFEAVERSNGPSPLCTGCAPCGCLHCGEIIVDDNGYKVKVNTYTVTHTYSGAGSFKIHSSDPDRNDGVHNMTNSGSQSFYLESLLVIANFSGANSSPVFNSIPTDKACIGKCFFHDPAPYDADGDSLSFELSTPRGANGQTVLGYFQPETNPGGTFNINAYNGKLTWCSPILSTEYNVAFIVKEWRRNTHDTMEVIGYVLRDMQIVVVNCPNNNPPDITVPQDTCVEAGALIKKNIHVTDLVISPPNDPASNRVTIIGLSGAFSVQNSQATLSNSFNVTPYDATFLWQTACDHIRTQPYLTTFKVIDQGPGSALANFNTYSIKVVPPPIKNVVANTVGSGIQLTWSSTTCNPSKNPLVSYKIYRKSNCDPFNITPCKTGVDPSSGYFYIGKTSPGTSFFYDTIGLIAGPEYSYIVIAAYKDGSESYGSSQVCAKLRRDIPILLNVDVRSTSNNSGSVIVRWALPLTTPGNLDTTALPGPYKINLKYRFGTTNKFENIYTTTSNYFLKLETVFTHSNINTVDSSLCYQLEFIAGSFTVGSSPGASSVFLKAISNDKRIDLNWQSNTPWDNYKYSVYRKDPLAAIYTAIATTTLTSYSDTAQIINNSSYCYKILSEGQYSDPTILRPLLNYSQETCATAKDLTPPCTPTLSVDSDCPTGFVKLKWTDLKKNCSADVDKYVLFYKSAVEENYQQVDTLTYNLTSFTYDGLSLVSGCYAVQAIDLSGNASSLSTGFCLDNCPEFELPNIFSPNNDKVNDLYKAIKVRQIKEIDLSVFDRWGNLVYRTNDPYFQWDGISLQSKITVSEGTFFYTCAVFEKRLTGIKKHELKGYLQVVR